MSSPDTYVRNIIEDAAYCQKKLTEPGYRHGHCADTGDVITGIERQLNADGDHVTRTLRTALQAAFANRLRPRGEGSHPEQARCLSTVVADVRETAAMIHHCLALPRRTIRLECQPSASSGWTRR